MATPKLKALRQDIKDCLTLNTSLISDQIIIVRDKDDWHKIESAVELADSGLAVHISESSGQNTNTNLNGNRKYAVNIVITIFSTYQLLEETDREEEVFEEIVQAMNTFATDLFPNIDHCNAYGTLLSWTHIPNDFNLYARAMTYRFPIVF